MQHSPCQNAKAAVLTNDCLYHIIRQFQFDRTQLHKLIFVNKFFFNAAVRHLYQLDPFSTTPPHKFSKLVSILFVSLLQAAVKEIIDTPSNNRTAPEIASEILGNFGLELKLPYQPSGITLLHEIYEHNSYYSPIECDPNVFSTMTIDYSKLYAGPSHLPLYGFPLFRIKSASIDNENINQSRSKVCSIVFPDVRDKLISPDLLTYLLWIHYNCTTITTISFNIEDARLYLPYASKLSSLDTIIITRREILDEPGFETTLTFIKKNQSSFPKKRPLRISVQCL